MNPHACPGLLVIRQFALPNTVKLCKKRLLGFVRVVLNPEIQYGQAIADTSCTGQRIIKAVTERGFRNSSNQPRIHQAQRAIITGAPDAHHLYIWQQCKVNKLAL